MSNIILEYMSGIWYIGDSMTERYVTYNQYLKDFESRVSQWYPLGDKMFRLDHGENYFDFFRRMGKPSYYASFDNEKKVQGTICFIYRKIFRDYVFYVCDLKFDLESRNKGLLKKLLYRTIPSLLLRTNKFYAVSMNEENTPNKILQMEQHIGNNFGINVEHGADLNIYSVDYQTMISIQRFIIIQKNNADFFSNSLSIFKRNQRYYITE